jgi:DNA polymerase-1
MIGEAREKGFATTLFGRRRYIPEMASENATIRAFAERTAINTPIQGTAADIIKVAMIAIHRELAERGLEAKMIIQVHDELVFNAPKDELDKVAEIVKDRMEGVIKLKVPIVSRLEAGENWLELERI